MPIEMLSDDSLLEIFSLYLDPVQRYPVASETGVAYAGSRVSKMAKCCFWITTSPELATLLHSQEAREKDVRHLARLAHFRTALPSSNIGHG